MRDAAGHASRVVQAPLIFIDDLAPDSEACCPDDEYEIATVEVWYGAWDPDDLSAITSVELWWRQRPDEESSWTSWALGPTVSSTDDPLLFGFPAGPGEYEFYTIATDAAGNREAPPEGADSSTVAVAPVARTTVRASLTNAGAEANATSEGPALSTDGRYVVFSSAASNLLAGDTNGVADIFVRDTLTGSTSRVSIDGAGSQADAASADPDISADGRYVVFSSSATNLVAGDTNTADDAFLHDRQTGSTVRLSVTSGGAQSDGASDQPAISADGRAVAFRSSATNLVAGDTNAAADIFVRDLVAGSTTRASLDSTGAQADAGSTLPAIAADGLVVVFESAATTLVANDTNDVTDIFVRDLATSVTSRASVTWDGSQGDAASSQPAISGDGLLVAFVTAATTFDGNDTNGVADVYVHHRDWVDTWRASVDLDDEDPDGAASGPSVSANGRYVAFVSSATDLVLDDANAASDAFVRDLDRGRSSRWSLTSTDAESTGSALAARISGDGTVVAFVSDAADLVAGDSNGVPDVFVRGPE